MVIRQTLSCPITGNKRTKIWKKTFFRKKLLYDYGFELLEQRTIGLKETYLGAPSVMKEYGDFIGYAYFYQNYIK